ncbi:class I SAM-dependent methyltransferase [Rhizobium mayense]|uniref:Class I SAM-dependent methyltransferase n=1 Tax=Rhizobium mayense TaxID=1312184 RepID=A0ABT7K5E2_9HYPH|nr:class I SAM-dependent methyltransferase [Rhizobium mayense]MDL2403831.1 class I SAM-dependent methyltransferase [Rhizobium mayense]
MSEENDYEFLLKDTHEKYLEFRSALRKAVVASRVKGALPEFIMGHTGKKVSIPQAKLDDCKVMGDRKDIIRQMPGDGVAIEVGTQAGLFAEFILTTHPNIKLHVVDMNYGPFRYDLLNPYIEAGRLSPIEGYSWEELSKFPDEHFDWIYIDASHMYDHVRQDLEMAKTKVKLGGHIICNDYTAWSPLEGDPYGVLQAVNEFLVSENFEVTHLSLDGWGYHDIAMQRLSDNGGSGDYLASILHNIRNS